MYAEGRGVEQSDTKAAAWFQTAAKRAEVLAQKRDFTPTADDTLAPTSILYRAVTKQAAIDPEAAYDLLKRLRDCCHGTVNAFVDKPLPCG
jgi:TPR repeat protein